MNTKEKEVRLPVTAAELEKFVAGIKKDFDLPDSDEVFEAIATAIMHLDNKMGHVKRSYFADCAVKFLCNQAAYAKLAEFDQNRRKQVETPAESERYPDSAVES